MQLNGDYKPISVDIVIPVKNGGADFKRHVNQWLRQAEAACYDLSIIVVNDGSTDGVPEALEQEFYDNGNIIFLHNSKSVGRGKSINLGVKIGAGEFIIVLDADCSPVSDFITKKLVDIAECNDLDVVYGGIFCKGSGFWAKYFNEVMDRRIKQFEKGDYAAFTTANTLFRRSVFESVSGFDEEFSKYGFEDKDLLLRIAKQTIKFAYEPGALVTHTDCLTLRSVCQKMYEAGKYSSRVFQNKHPEYYRNTMFYRADASIYGSKVVLKGFHFLFSVRWCWLKFFGILISTPIPYSFKKNIVRFSSGLFFAFGRLR